MALQLPLSDGVGNEYPDAYRRWSFLLIDIPSKVIRAEFLNYKSKADRDAGRDPFGNPTVYRVTEHTTPSYEDFVAAAYQGSSGVGNLVYGFARMQPENALAEDV